MNVKNTYYVLLVVQLNFTTSVKRRSRQPPFAQSGLFLQHNFERTILHPVVSWIRRNNSFCSERVNLNSLPIRTIME